MISSTLCQFFAFIFGAHSEYESHCQGFNTLLRGTHWWVRQTTTFKYLGQYASHGFDAVSLCKENVKRCTKLLSCPRMAQCQSAGKRNSENRAAERATCPVKEYRQSWSQLNVLSGQLYAYLTCFYKKFLTDSDSKLDHGHEFQQFEWRYNILLSRQIAHTQL